MDKILEPEGDLRFAVFHPGAEELPERGLHVQGNDLLEPPETIDAIA